MSNQLALDIQNTDQKPQMHISFSGGLSSAYMTEWLMKNLKDQYDFIVTFANTGLELEETLEFVRKCDEEKGFNTVWLEADVHPEKRTGTTHTIVDFHTATRNGSVFEKMIEKYGIPNMVYKHCTRELKVRPMNSYLRSLGIKPNKIPTAIGIRADEAKRMAKDAHIDNLIYPLVSMEPTTKEQVHAYWNAQPFTLGLEEHNGNCVMCFEKSFSKLLKQMEEYPEALAFHEEMERKHGQTNNKAGMPDRVFFRKKTSALDLRSMAQEQDSKEVEQTNYADTLLVA